MIGLLILGICSLLFLLGLKIKRLEWLRGLAVMIAWIGLWIAFLADGLPVLACAVYCLFMTALMVAILSQRAFAVPVIWLLLLIIVGVRDLSRLERPKIESMVVTSGQYVYCDKHRYCSPTNENACMFTAGTDSAVVRRYSKCAVCGKRWTQHHTRQMTLDEYAKYLEQRAIAFSTQWTIQS